MLQLPKVWSSSYRSGDVNLLAKVQRQVPQLWYAMQNPLQTRSRDIHAARYVQVLQSSNRRREEGQGSVVGELEGRWVRRDVRVVVLVKRRYGWWTAFGSHQRQMGQLRRGNGQPIRHLAVMQLEFPEVRETQRIHFGFIVGRADKSQLFY